MWQLDFLYRQNYMHHIEEYSTLDLTRLHPLEIKNGKLYVIQGLSARIIVPLSMIKEIQWGGSLPSKDMLKFVYKDFEELEPQAVIHLHEPVEATMFLDMKKSVTKFAVRVDEPEKLKALLTSEENVSIQI